MSLFLRKIGIRSWRTVNIARHVTASVVFKAGALLANFLLVPITIDYLGNENYGVWLTISSFILWFSFLDIGLGNGLRNKLVEVKAKGDEKLAQRYVSSAYFGIMAISLIFLFSFLIVNQFVNWSFIFNADKQYQSDLNHLIPFVLGFFCLQLVFKLVISIYLSEQNHSIDTKFQFGTQIISLIIIWGLSKISKNSILIYGIIFSVIPVGVLLVINCYSFCFRYKYLRPRFSLWRKNDFKNLMDLGYKFFIIQVSWLVVFTTDNFIISYLFGPEHVVPYSLALRYFSVITMAYLMLVTPYWSSFTDAYFKNDFNWIKKSVNGVLRIWLAVPVLLVIMLLLSDWFYGFWVGEKVKVPFVLSLAMAVFVLLQTYAMIFTFFVNGIGKIKLQLLISILSMIINIPLSVLLAKTFGLGTSGIIYATICSLMLSSVIAPIQYYKIINNNAEGIWSE